MQGQVDRPRGTEVKRVPLGERERGPRVRDPLNRAVDDPERFFQGRAGAEQPTESAVAAAYARDIKIARTGETEHGSGPPAASFGQRNDVHHALSEHRGASVRERL